MNNIHRIYSYTNIVSLDEKKGFYMKYREKPRAGEFYYHFKKKLYQVVGVAYHSETREELVIYQALYGDYSMCARPLEMFMSEVDIEKYPEVTQTYRFEKIEQHQIQQVMEQQNTQIVENHEQSSKQLSEDSNQQSKEHYLEVSNIETSMLIQNSKQELSQGSMEDKRKKGNDILLKILESNSYKEKINLLEQYKDEMTESMLESIAISMDIYLEDGCLEEKYYNIKRCLETHLKYEGSRIRG